MITLTENAAQHISSYLDKRGSGVGVRLYVKTTGCSGLMYVMEPVDDVEEDDFVFCKNGSSLFISPKDMVYLKGTVVDYVKKGINEGFEFSNPNAKSYCGCGESFTV